MSLDHSQKKFIKRNIRKLSLNDLCTGGNFSREEVLGYLKDIWNKDKYEKYRLAAIEVTSESWEDFLNGRKAFISWIKNHWKIFAVLALLVFIVYINGLNNAFTSDSKQAILDNPDAGNWAVMQNKSRNYVRNFVMYALYKIDGPNPVIYRSVNIIAHFFSASLIYLVISYFRKRNRGIDIVALFTAMIFAVHPLLVESVTWVAGGSYSHYTLFFLISFVLYLSSKHYPLNYFLALVMFVVAGFYTEKAFVLFSIFILYELLYGDLSRVWKRILPFVGLGIMFLFIMLGRFGNRVSTLQSDYYLRPGTENPLLQIPVAISEYLHLIFWPDILTLYHTELTMNKTEFSIRALVTLLFLSVIFYLYWKIRDKSWGNMLMFWKKSSPSNENAKLLFFWFVLFWVALSPTLTPFRVSWVVAERYVYVSTIGIFVAIALLFEQLGKRETWRFTVYTIFGLMLIAFSVRTMVRNRDWKSEDTLWVATAKTSPSSPNTHSNLADVYARHGLLDKSAEEFAMAIKIDPNYADAYHNLATVYMRQGKMDEAIEVYKKAVELNPRLWQSYQNLGLLTFKKGDYEQAEKYFLAAYKQQPQADITYGLGITYAKLGDLDKTRELFAEILVQDPNNTQVQEALKQLGTK